MGLENDLRETVSSLVDQYGDDKVRSIKELTDSYGLGLSEAKQLINQELSKRQANPKTSSSESTVTEIPQTVPDGQKTAKDIELENMIKDTIACPTCGKEMLRAAGFCPYCKKDKNSKKIGCSTIVLLIGLLFWLIYFLL